MSVICQYCTKEFASYKSWHRHKTLKHPEKLGVNHCIRASYESNPKVCKGCKQPIPFEKRRQNFCCQSCSAKTNNGTRTDHGDKLRAAWRKKNGHLRGERPRVEKRITKKPCAGCGKIFQVSGNGHRFCRPTCNKSKVGKINYRFLCRFRLNNVNHSKLFNGKLIAKYGWYTPANKGSYNPNGVCWDHLYRVEEGFANGIDPLIMSHPANAELVPWKVNKQRQESLITYSELLERIKTWDEGRFNDLIYFFEYKE